MVSSDSEKMDSPREDLSKMDVIMPKKITGILSKQSPFPQPDSNIPTLKVHFVVTEVRSDWESQAAVKSYNKHMDSRVNVTVYRVIFALWFFFLGGGGYPYTNRLFHPLLNSPRQGCSRKFKEKISPSFKFTHC